MKSESNQADQAKQTEPSQVDYAMDIYRDVHDYAKWTKPSDLHQADEAKQTKRCSKAFSNSDQAECTETNSLNDKNELA